MNYLQFISRLLLLHMFPLTERVLLHQLSSFANLSCHLAPIAHKYTTQIILYLTSANTKWLNFRHFLLWQSFQTPFGPLIVVLSFLSFQNFPLSLVFNTIYLSFQAGSFLIVGINCLIFVSPALSIVQCLMVGIQ